ncbi:DUF6624 domain-containing protein [Asaia bogorensis]|uniref:DUF6624 domain-containing protein n=1 Tax=Asaia bogorensis TaxID=91915 RepID=UPI0028593406|nr:DUF6624 domain-containing protein [Asaia bogorensis]MDR6184078.1 hypothetical protein [Asaia bogorensis NBRC 16594]
MINNIANIVRSIAFMFCLLAISASAPPPIISKYIHDGEFDAGDYAFLRGAFPDATIQQTTDWQTLQSYILSCRKEAVNAERAELKRLGVEANLNVERGYQNHLCTQISFATQASKDFGTWDAFSSAMSRSQPYFQTYDSAVSMAVRSLDREPETDTFEEELMLHSIPDQMWRFAVMGVVLPSISGLDTATRSALRIRIFLAQNDVDWQNSHWARHILETQGWSSAIKAGKKSAKLMWLLVQHADDDPAFQVMAIRQLEPVAKSGHFPKQNYALLSDRVNLATTGKQHYGSQLSCQNHHLLPYLMDTGGDDEKTLDARRAKMDLPPEATYIEQVQKSFPQAC